MLSLTRRSSESIYVNGLIEIKILNFNINVLTVAINPVLAGHIRKLSLGGKKYTSIRLNKLKPLHISNDIEIVYVRKKGQSVIVGIDAPRHMSIRRSK